MKAVISESLAVKNTLPVVAKSPNLIQYVAKLVEKVGQFEPMEAH